MIQACIDLVLGRAFIPDPLDAGIALSRRFAKRPLIAVTMYKDGFEAVPITFSKEGPVFGAVEFCPAGTEESDAAFLRVFADRNKARECLANVATGYTAVLSSRTRRPESEEEAIALMRDNPERLLGEPAAQGCRHSIAYHPTHNFAVVFAHRETEISLAVNLASRAGLGMARLQCGASSLLTHLMANCWSEVGKEAELLIVERASVFYLAMAEGALGRPLFDIGLKEAALKQAVEERVGRLKPGGRVLLVNSSGIDVESMLKAKNPDATIVTPLKDWKQPALAACCSDTPALGYDLFPVERMVRPFAPARLRIVPPIFWGSAAATIALVGINLFHASQSDRLAANLKHQVNVLNQAKTRMAGVMADVKARSKAAGDMRDWLGISPPTQALLIQITKAIQDATQQGLQENKVVARVDSMSLIWKPGQPQMRFSVVVIGDSAANRVFQQISTLFGRLGFSTVDLRESLVPQGFRYEHSVNLPTNLVP